ncbi:SUMF1/EgtB/PvdO family nonheme iron enzyme [Terrarubrum flagellatum]|uniref:SUMF1/EgtB/PvdO family nonheme iron enzyme n=1 Tax=Terrirubrum flagellatum TaxID=2895980 RepID=UPI0031450ADF
MCATESEQRVRSHCIALVERLAGAELVASPYGSLSLEDGYIPLLANYTEEDKAAKGLRSLRDAAAQPAPQAYFSALEVTQTARAVMLLGPRGSGKTSFARRLALNLAGELVNSQQYNLTEVTRPVFRNEQGMTALEEWRETIALPFYVEIRSASSLSELLVAAGFDIEAALAEAVSKESIQDVFLILDGIDRLGSMGPSVLADASALMARYPKLRVLALGEATIVRSWPSLAEFSTHDMLPLLAVQRRAFIAERSSAQAPTPAQMSNAATNPGLFALSLWLNEAPSSPEAMVDAWLDQVLEHCDTGAADRLCKSAFENLRSGGMDFAPDAKLQTLLVSLGLCRTVRKPYLVELLAARHLAVLPPSDVAKLFHQCPDTWMAPVKSLASRLATRNAPPDALVNGLIDESESNALRGALIAAPMVFSEGALQSRIGNILLRLIENGALSPTLRAEAGRVLARWGDPRDLDAMVDIPVGDFVMGSNTHPNSTPPHRVHVRAFKIGRFPVTNRSYGAFVAETERHWASKDGRSPERANAPAIDLTWRDAIAYCEWLTARWRAEGRIDAEELVRLPTEPEWERAARGDQPDRGNCVVYPWGSDWSADAANSEESGFNDTCAVGLFPKGRSPYGCYDMAGQVWEWTSTLWGDDMATPSFKYPYDDDGREASDAGPHIRRVLRGGCFSSGRLKACCTYRGSLEPDGFWRGNGFRIVVASPAALESPH